MHAESSTAAQVPGPACDNSNASARHSLSRLSRQISKSVFGSSEAETGQIVPKSEAPGKKKKAAPSTAASNSRLHAKLGSAPKKRIKEQPQTAKPVRVEDAASALLEAAERGDAEKCHELLVARACPQDAADKAGMTAMHRAAKAGHVETVETLLELQLDDEARDKKGRTALHLAAAAGRIEVLELLLDIGADVDVRASLELKEWSPLMFAAASGQIAIIGALLLADSDLLDSRDSDSRTAFEIAQQHSQQEAADALLMASDARSVRSRKQRSAEAAQKRAMLQRRNSKVSLRGSANFDLESARRASLRGGEARTSALYKLSRGFRHVSAAAGAIASLRVSSRRSSGGGTTRVSFSAEDGAEVSPPRLSKSSSAPSAAPPSLRRPKGVSV